MVLRSSVSSANDPETDFPLQNLPYGIFRAGNENRIGVAIGDRILDLRGCANAGLLAELPMSVVSACTADVLNPLMASGPAAWSTLRRKLMVLLGEESACKAIRERVEPLLVPMSDAVMQLPAQIGGYTDFYASIHHAERVGRLFRPENPLLPNYKYVPIGYNGRTSSIVVSGTAIRRPCGQLKPQQAEPVFAPAQSLDYELEIGAFVGPGNAPGQPIPIAEAEEHIFGLCLVNDWSARDIQSWEYQPLGPFLAKNFATTISPWVVPMEALAPFRVPACERPAGDPAPLPYLRLPHADRVGIDLTLEVYLASESMRQAGISPMLLSRGNLRHLYWALAQLIAHHASNGCNLRPGDLLATGTVSGPEEGSEGCLLEKRHHPEPLRLPSGEERTFLEDGDRVTFRAYCQKPGWPRIGFGECTGTIVSASVKG
ncbi:MAG TPA: fumarylacetoacetase [Terracidiphilus sp.]|nr:fumarylacetoacetase [Terracidiphilus sp.]